MKRITSKEQREYSEARTALGALKAQEQEIERRYMRKHGIVDEDGNVPMHLWCIDDDQTFETAVAATADEIESLGIIEAERRLKAAEDALIRYGLSIMPARYKHEREVLTNSCFGLNGYVSNITTREKIIGYTLRLDVSTVPA